MLNSRYKLYAWYSLTKESFEPTFLSEWWKRSLKSFRRQGETSHKCLAKEDLASAALGLSLISWQETLKCQALADICTQLTPFPYTHQALLARSQDTRFIGLNSLMSTNKKNGRLSQNPWEF